MSGPISPEDVEFNLERSAQRKKRANKEVEPEEQEERANEPEDEEASNRSEGDSSDDDNSGVDENEPVTACEFRSAQATTQAALTYITESVGKGRSDNRIGFATNQKEFFELRTLVQSEISKIRADNIQRATILEKKIDDLAANITPLPNRDTVRRQQKTVGPRRLPTTKARARGPPTNSSAEPAAKRPPMTPEQFQEKFGCIFCGQAHAPHHCTSVRTFSARMTKIQSGRWCVNCLAHKSRPGQPCRHPPATCVACKEAHHSVTCELNALG